MTSYHLNTAYGFSLQVIQVLDHEKILTGFSNGEIFMVDFGQNKETKVSSSSFLINVPVIGKLIG